MATIITLSNHEGGVKKTALTLSYLSVLLSILVLSLSIISCGGSGLEGGRQESPLVMKILSSNLVGRQRTIEVHFSLSEDTERAILERFQLKATLDPMGRDNKLRYTNAAGKKKDVPNEANNLTFFTRVSELGLEDEVLVVPFTIYPAADINTISVQFELFNREGETIQTCNATWNREESTTLPINSREAVADNTIPMSLQEDTLPEIMDSNNSTTANSEGAYITSISTEQTDSLNDSRTRKRLRSISKLLKPTKKAKLKEGIGRGQQEVLEKAANQGDAIAQRMLGVMYYCGQGVGRNYEQALLWFTKAANQNYAEAQGYLGVMYRNGEGTDRDYEQALSWFTKAANQNDAKAQYNLGIVYYHGQGRGCDYEQALSWFTKAANQDFAQAQRMLGVMYLNGEGTGCDYEQALSWFTKAANQNDAKAQYNLGIVYYYGQGVGRNYEQALLWFTKAANQNYAEAQGYLGVMYRNGEGTDRDYEQALSWFTKAANQNDVEAQGYLGVMYYHGQGVERDYEQALSWYAKAANQNDAEAQYSLGAMYYHGQGVERNYEQALAWYAKAANQNDAEAQRVLGVMYYHGQGVDINLTQAIFWFVKSKSKIDLLGILTNNPEILSASVQFEEEPDHSYSELLASWQAMVIQKERDRSGEHATFPLECYQELEKIMVQLIKWQYQLSEQTGLMISCLSFKDLTHISLIEQQQRKTNVTPYIKQSAWQGKSYLSLGESNVKLADEIVDELAHQALYKKAQGLLTDLENIYKMVHREAASKASYIEEMLQQKELSEIKRKKLLNKLSKKNEIAKQFADKVKSIQEEAAQFTAYYNLVLAQVKKGQGKRNQKFQKEHDWLFN
jgi:TPR repeat protein